MSWVIPALPSGKIPDALMNHPNSIVTHLKPDTNSDPSEKIIGQKAVLGPKKTPPLLDGMFHAKDITHMLKPPVATGPVYDRYEGKTVVENESLPQIVVSSRFTEDGQLIISPGDENYRAKLGVPTHGFFFHDTDFLLDAAKEYAKLEDDEVFKYRNINDINFVRDTLDFFTDGNYSSGDVKAVQNQMEDLVRELGKQIKNGGEPDLSKLETTLTIGGADVTIGQLLDFQQVGKELIEPFDNLCIGQLNTKMYSKAGVAKSISDYYGSDKGQLGEMFSSAMGRLYDKGIAQCKDLYASNPSKWNVFQKDSINTSFDIAELFSNMDTSSKENFSKDFTDKLATARSMAKGVCNKYGIPFYSAGLAGDTADVMKFFNQWMDKI